ncbi:MAG: hypothetical protein PHY00_02465 [Bacilli bacterium]|nr:hypothetical protein [Bacilli bacterium]
MKKLKILMLLTTLLLVGCGIDKFTWKETIDSSKFKEEYEILNNTKTSSGNEYLEIEVPSANPFKYLTIEETISLLEEGTGIIYFGMPECPYCRSTIEPLLEMAKENKIEVINYYNPVEIRKENSEDYQKIIELLHDFLRTDKVNQSEEDLNFNPELKRLLVPDVYFINKGQVVSHYAESEHKTKLDKDQLKEVLKKYQSAYDDYDAAKSMCDEGC